MDSDYDEPTPVEPVQISLDG
jgi:CRP-like cAMP-binding protein